MIRLQNISLSPEERYNIGKGELHQHINELGKFIAKLININPKDIFELKIIKESIDARKELYFILTVEVSFSAKQKEEYVLKKYKFANKVTSPSILQAAKYETPPIRPVIVGFGPAGIFAALQMLDLGIAPIVLERGAAIPTRAEDIQNFIHKKILKAESNIQFGEGGAGTFSDAKLSTGVKSEYIKFILECFVRFGAPESILYKAMPHIGTDIIRKVIINIREYLLKNGVSIHFHSKLKNIIVQNSTLIEIEFEDTQNHSIKKLPCEKLLLCIGHSSRDTVEMLYQKGVFMQAKPFAIGVRIEHRQKEVNVSRYHSYAEHPIMPQASYNLNEKTPDGRGVYSFCMCPGGEVVMASSEEKGVLVNGMSYYARDEINANSALLVGVSPADFDSEHPLAGFALQRKIEQAAYHAVGDTYIAPVQNLANLLGKGNNSIGSILPSCKNGYTLRDLSEILPNYIIQNLRYAIPKLANKMECFGNLEAILSGVETRSSSPVRILRDTQGQTNIKGLYGAGEGAGFAGGIMSSAIDGMKISKKMFEVQE